MVRIALYYVLAALSAIRSLLPFENYNKAEAAFVSVAFFAASALWISCAEIARLELKPDSSDVGQEDKEI